MVYEQLTLWPNAKPSALRLVRTPEAAQRRHLRLCDPPEHGWRMSDREDDDAA